MGVYSTVARAVGAQSQYFAHFAQQHSENVSFQFLAFPSMETPRFHHAARRGGGALSMDAVQASDLVGADPVAVIV
jgi:hypothetical protein